MYYNIAVFSLYQLGKILSYVVIGVQFSWLLSGILFFLFEVKLRPVQMEVKHDDRNPR